MLLSGIGLLPTGNGNQFVSRPQRRREERFSRKRFKRSVPTHCKDKDGKVLECSEELTTACSFQFNLKEDPSLQLSGCAKPPEGGAWGSGMCVAQKGKTVVVCFCDDGDNCGDKATMEAKAKDAYIDKNPITTTTTSTETPVGESTTSSTEGGFPVVGYVGIAGGVLALVLAGVAIYFLIKWCKGKKEKDAAKKNDGSKEDNKKKNDATTDTEEKVSPDEERSIVQSIGDLAKDRSNMEELFAEVRKDVDNAEKKSTMSTNGVLIEAENNVAILAIPRLSDVVSFLMKLIDRDVQRVILVDFSDEAVLNLLPNDDLYAAENSAETGEAIRTCVGDTVTFTSKGNQMKAILTYGNEQPIDGMKGIVRRSLNLQISGVKKNAKIDVLIGYAFRRKICNFEGCAVAPKLLAYSPTKTTAILLPSLADYRGLSILLSTRLLLDVKESRPANLKGRLSEALKNHPETNEFNGEVLKVTVAITLCAMRQRVARTLPQAHSNTVDEFCTKTIIEMYDPTRG